MKFSGLNTKLLTQLTQAAASITQVAPVGVSSHWKSQITVGMIRFGRLLASPFFVFPFRGSGLRENYFCYSAGFSPANLSEQPLDVVVGVETVSH
jgi:hypothetical protein